MTKYDTEGLIKVSNRIRKDVVGSLLEAGSGHSAGSLGSVDILTALYFSVMAHDPAKPDWQDRDRLFISNGHIAPALYATLAHAGYFPVKELATLRKFESRLQGHPEKGKLPGVESTSGPLGEGLAQAAGYALASRMDNKRFRIFCLSSDGEHDEGSHWEAVLFAAKYNLSNLTLFVDRNNIQIDGHTEDVMPLEPLQEKYRSFGWHVLHIDGHNFDEIIASVNHARAVYEDPTVIIAHTIPGKGVSFMENIPEWHGSAPSKEEADRALKELRTLGGKIISGND